MNTNLYPYIKMGIKSRHPPKMGINQNDLKSANAYKIGIFQVSRI